MDAPQPEPVPDSRPEPDLAGWRANALAFEAAIGKAVLGQKAAIRLLTIAILARGHALLEGDVGVGKTTLLRAAARALGGPYARVEGTIDLMPADLVYHATIGPDGRPRLDPGPVLAHGEALTIFFFNEINRARPHVHALLLRLMAERSVTAFNREILLPNLLVFADRNRLERDETFELPAAARDRFFLQIPLEAPRDPAIARDLLFDTRFHDPDRLIETVPDSVLDYQSLPERARQIQASITQSPHLERYLVALWQALRDPACAGIRLEGVDMTRLVQGGASPRAMSALVRGARVQAFLAGRDCVLPEDIRALLHPALGHRIFLDPLYAHRADALVRSLLDAVQESVPVP